MHTPANAAISAAVDNRNRDKQTLVQSTAALALSCAALSLILLSLNANAEITQDCILEGTVDKRKAEQMGQPVYVKFRNATRASDVGCSVERRSRSRRVKFVSNPNAHEIENAEHGTRVRYRYIEKDRQSASWELMEVKDPDQS